MKHWDKASIRRGKPKAEFDQLFATRATVRGRVRVLVDNDDLGKKRVLLIGDDDLLSMAIEDAPERFRFPPQVTVVDIDDGLLHILSQSSSRGKGLTTLRYDVRNPFPECLKSLFDVVFTDPPYTVDGQAMFLSRARAALKNKSSSVCYVCYSSKDLWGKSVLKVQKVINEMGFVIDACFPSFNRYESAKRRKSEKKIVDFESNLLRLRLIPGAGRKRVLVGKRIYRYD